jgi:hypothetical protein
MATSGGKEASPETGLLITAGNSNTFDSNCRPTSLRSAVSSDFHHNSFHMDAGIFDLRSNSPRPPILTS